MHEDLLKYRRERTQEFGAATMDNAMASFRCRKCEQPVADPAVRVIADVSYRDLASFGKMAKRLSKGLAESDSPACAQCSGQSELVHLNLFGFHQPAGRDVVARATPPGGLLRRQKVTFHWWDGGPDFEEFDRFSAEDDFGFRLSALIRRAEILPMLEGTAVEPLLEEGERLLQERPGHPLLLALVPGLLNLGRSGLGAAIAEAHVETWPNDADGHAWLGQIIFMVVNHGAMPPESIEEALESLGRALRIDPGHVQASLTLANCHRLRGDSDTAKQAYSQILEHRPDFAPAHYNLGLMALEADDGEAALHHFREGQSAEPQDPDYPVGVARALVALGRNDEARHPLERAKDLGSEHPLLPQIEAAVDSSRPPS